jgi:hypothetical protein
VDQEAMRMALDENRTVFPKAARAVRDPGQAPGIRAPRRGEPSLPVADDQVDLWQRTLAALAPIELG